MSEKIDADEIVCFLKSIEQEQLKNIQDGIFLLPLTPLNKNYSMQDTLKCKLIYAKNFIDMDDKKMHIIERMLKYLNNEKWPHEDIPSIDP